MHLFKNHWFWKSKYFQLQILLRPPCFLSCNSYFQNHHEGFFLSSVQKNLNTSATDDWKGSNMPSAARMPTKSLSWHPSQITPRCRPRKLHGSNTFNGRQMDKLKGDVSSDVSWSFIILMVHSIIHHIQWCFMNDIQNPLIIFSWKGKRRGETNNLTSTTKKDTTHRHHFNWCHQKGDGF